MRVVLDHYFDDQIQKCTKEGCGFYIGPYDEQWMNDWCPRCFGPLQFFRAYGTLEERSRPVHRSQARIPGRDY